jgi:DNA-binding CsgD family transcriptional regulator
VVSEEVTLYLETTERHFARWLRDHVSRNLSTPHVGEDGVRIYLEGTMRPQRDGFASRIDIGAVAASQAGSVPMGTAISVRYMEHRPGTMEVTAQCHLPEAADYFEELLAAMKASWPEGRPKTPISAQTPEAEEPVPGISARRSVYPHVRERERVIERLWHEGFMIWQIAQQANCSESTVNRCLKKLGLARRSKS